MTLTPEERQSIIDYRLERAKQTFREAEDVAALNHWNLAANRLYYAIFYAGNALLLSRQLAPTSHRGFMSLFHLHFIKTGEIDNTFGKLVRDLFRLRQSGDYDDIFDLSAEDVEIHFEATRRLIELISEKIK